MALRSLARTRAHARLLGRGTAVQKLACFLLEMLARDAAGVIELAMTRQDIADYLGLTIETVSRTLSQMERGGTLIMETPRQLRVPSRAALTELAA